MDAIINRLVASIQERELVIFCGAGVSLSAPSSVPGAAALTLECIAQYNQRALLPALPAHATTNLETLTEYLFAQGHQRLFVRNLVPWRSFMRVPNSQHIAIADFLSAGAIEFGVTTNFDVLIEKSAMDLGEDRFDPSTTADQANIAREHRPFLKLHGCATEPDYTLWCHTQLEGPVPVSDANKVVRGRIDSLQVWLRANLREKTVLFVGFWTDWSYLGSVLAESVNAVHIPLVVLVDPQPDADLEAKAPQLWAWAKSNTEFVPIKVEGEIFLPRLRKAFSVNFLERILRNAADSFTSMRPGKPIPSTAFDAVDVAGPTHSGATPAACLHSASRAKLAQTTAWTPSVEPIY